MAANGQWIGTYGGTNSGSLLVDLDDRGAFYEGYGYAFSAQPVPTFFARLRTQNKDATQSLPIEILPINPRTNTPLTADELVKFYPDVPIPKSGSLKFAHADSTLNVEITTDIGTTLTAALPRTMADQPSALTPISSISSWHNFRERFSTLKPRARIFRGQRRPERLRTTFHRTGRADIYRFRYEDIPILHRHLTSRTKHLFNLNDPDQFGAFLNLAQHHGYPTPLLDWTYSPFVAAFFAYRHVAKTGGTSGNSEKVRIFMFDADRWKQDWPQNLSLTPYGANLSVIEFLALDNERLVPQQSASTITNIDDVESFIGFLEAQKDHKYLEVIDLPVSERTDVMQELSVTGITAGALFPGLDGACEELKERLF